MKSAYVLDPIPYLKARVLEPEHKVRSYRIVKVHTISPANPGLGNGKARKRSLWR